MAKKMPLRKAAAAPKLPSIGVGKPRIAPANPASPDPVAPMSQIIGFGPRAVTMPKMGMGNPRSRRGKVARGPSGMMGSQF